MMRQGVFDLPQDPGRWLQPFMLVRESHAAIGAQLADGIDAGGVVQDRLNRWIVTHMVMSTSAPYAEAAMLLLKRGLWQPSAPAIRTIFELGSVLGFIVHQAGREEDFAELYGLSDALDRRKMANALCRLRPELSREMDQVDAGFAEYISKAAALGICEPGSHKALKSWNGRSVEDTFRVCGIALQYDTWYRELCLFAHASSFGSLYGSRQAIGARGMEAESYWARRLGVACTIALLAQLQFAAELTGLRPDGDLGEVQALLRDVYAET